MTERERGQSAKGLLKVAWDYPTYTLEASATSGSAARPMRQALASEAAFRTLAGQDPRPLLVLRECEVCNGTDDALLSKGADNERTFLLSTWFHCVKLPVDVLKENHPFYELFGHDDPEHLFVSMPDGSLKLKLESQTSRTELLDAMGQVLAAAYKDDPQPVVKFLQKSLERMDLLDAKLLELRIRRGELIESEGQSSKKIAKLDLEIAESDSELTSTKAAIAKATRLELKNAAALPESAPPTKAAR